MVCRRCRRCPNGIIRINADGTRDLIANLSAFGMAFPVAHPEPDDFEPDGTWYSMIVARDGNRRYFYAVEPNHQEIDRISPTTGEISRVVDISASFPPPAGTNRNWVGPTSIALRDGDNFFFGTSVLLGSSPAPNRFDRSMCTTASSGLSPKGSPPLPASHSIVNIECTCWR